jgi:hypothetical protein
MLHVTKKTKQLGPYERISYDVATLEDQPAAPEPLDHGSWVMGGHRISGVAMNLLSIKILKTKDTLGLILIKLLYHVPKF